MVRYLALILSILFASFPSYAAPPNFVYQGQIIKPDSNPLEAASVNFTIQILSPAPNHCVLYEETHTGINMTGSNGLFALPVGGGTSTANGHYHPNFVPAFDNSAGSVNPANCDVLAAYDANAGDLRVLRVSFDDGGGPVAVADMTIRSVPFAEYASSVGGVTASEILQADTSTGRVLDQTNLLWVFENNARFTEFQAIVGGTSSQYISSSPSATVNLNGQVLDNIAAPTDSDDATNKNYVDTKIGGQNADTLITTPTITQDGYVISWNNTSNEYELVDGSAAFGDNLGNHTATANIQTGSNFISNDGTASQGLSFDGTNNANFSQNLTVSQGFSVTNGINSAGNIATQSESEFRMEDNAGGEYVGLKAPATVIASYTMELPDAASPAAGRILKSNASGDLIWATDDDSGGDITSGSNVGAGGVDVYKQENAGLLEFKSINNGSGISIFDDVVNNEVDINIDIAGLVDESTADNADTIIIRDDSDSGNLKEMTRANFVLSEAEVDGFVSDNGYLGSVSGTELDNVWSSNGILVRTGVATYSQITDNSSNWNTAFGWGDHGAAGYLTSFTEADTLATVTGRGATTTTAITVDGAADAVQLTVEAHSTQTTNDSILELKNSAGTVIGSFPADGTIDTSTHLATKAYVDGQVSGSGDVTGGSSVGVGGQPIFKQENAGVLEFHSINAASNKVSVAADAGNNEVDIDVVEANIDHNSLSNVTANEHIDHSSVNIGTAAGSGLTGGGDLTTTRNITVDIAGTADEASVESADSLLIRDNSDSGNLKEMTRENFVLSEAEVDSFVSDNGYLGSVSGTELDNVWSSNGILVRTGAATYSQITDNSANWNTAFGWGDHGAAGYLTSFTEADTLATVTGRGATTTTAITVDGAADAVQLTVEAHSTQTTNDSILELKNSAGTVIGSFPADGTIDTATHLATKNYVDSNFGGSTLDLTGLANNQSIRWNNALTRWEVFTPAAGGESNDGANVGGGTGQIYRDKTGTDINLKTIAAGSTKLSVTNNANDVTLDVVEANIDHNSLSNVTANEHIDHSSVNIGTAAGSGLTGGGDLTATRNITVDIAGTADEASVESADSLLIRDNSDSGNLKEMTRENFVLSEAEVDSFVSDNGYLGSVSGTELDNVWSSNGILVRTGAATYSQITDNSANWNTAFGWGDHGAAGYLTSFTEADTLATVTGRGATTTTAITVDGSADAVQLTVEAHSTQTTNDSILELKNSAGTVIGSFPADGTIDTSTHLATKAYVDGQVSGSGDVTGGSSVGAGGQPVFKQENAGVLEFHSINAASNKVSVAADAGNNEVDIDVVEANIDHNSLSNVTANEHIDHSSVNIGTAAGSGLTGGGDLTTTRNITVDIAGTADEVSVESADSLLIRDNSDSGNLKEMTRENFVLSEAEVDSFVSDNGYLGSVSGTELDNVWSSNGILVRTGAATYSQITDNSANWNTAFGWGDHSAAGYLTSFTEADTLATVTGRGATTTTAITVDGAADAVQLTLEAHSTQTTNDSILELKNSAGTVIGSFPADGTIDTATHLATKNYVDSNFGGSTLDLTGLANNQSIRWNNALTRWEVFTPSAGGESNDGANVGGGTGQIYRDKTGTDINLKTIAAGSTKLSVTNNANDVTLDVVEVNIDHNNLSNVTANEHIDHSSVNIGTAVGSGLTGGGDLTTTRNITVDIAGTADEVSVESADSLLIRDNSDSGNLKEMTRENFVLSEAEVDSFVSDNGYLGSVSGTELDNVWSSNGILVRTGAATYSQITDNSANWNTAFGWGDHGAAGYLTSFTEADTLATVTGRGATTTTAITVDGAADAVQLTVEAHSTQTTNDSILELKNSAGTVIGSFPADGTIDTATHLATKAYVDAQASGGDVTGGSSVGAGGQPIFKQENAGVLEFHSINAASNKVSVAADAGNNEVDIDVVEANIDHNSLSNVTANEHIDHSSVNIGTAADSGLTGGGDLTTTRNIAVDINGTTAETSIAASDEILIYDASVPGLRKMVYSNFIAGIITSGTNVGAGGVDVFKQETAGALEFKSINDGVGISVSDDVVNNEVDINIDIASVTDEATADNADSLLIRDNSDSGNIKEMTRANFLSGVLTSESDTLATVTGRGATTTTAITVDGAADAVQLTVEGHSTQSTNANILELKDSTGTVQGSFRADGVETAGTDLTTKNYVDGNFGGSTLDLTGLANNQSIRWNNALTRWEVFTPSAGGESNDGANVGGGTGQIYRDKTGTDINLKTIAAGSTKLSVTNNANDVTLDVVEVNIDHNNLSNVTANEHINHSSVNIGTAAGSGLTGGGDLTATRNITVDIAGTADEASVESADSLLIRDNSDSGNLKEMTRENFVLSEAEVDSFVSDNGYLGSVSGTELDNVWSSNGILVRTGVATYSQITDNSANWNTAFGWGDHGAAGYLTSFTEADTLATVTGRGATTTTAITVDGAADAVQLTVEAHSTQTTNDSILELKNSAGTVIGSFPADGTIDTATHLATKAYVDSQASGGDVTGGSSVGVGGQPVFKQENAGVLEFHSINAASNKVSVAADAGNNEVDIDVVEANIDHNSLSNVTANEHIDHSSVNIGTAADSGLTGGGDLTTTRNIAVDINGTTAETSIAAGDEILIYDASVPGLRKMVYSNFIAGIITSGNNVGAGGVDVFKQETAGALEFKSINDGVGISISDDVVNNEVDINIDIASVTDEATADNADSLLIRDNSDSGNIKEMTRANFLSGVLTSESDTLATVTGRGATTTTAIAVDGSADAVQLTLEAHSTQTTNDSMLELKNSAGTVIGSFPADGTIDTATHLATKAYVDAQAGGGIQSGVSTVAVVGAGCSTVGELAKDASNNLMVCDEPAGAIQAADCSTFNAGAVTFDSMGATYICR